MSPELPPAQPFLPATATPAMPPGLRVLLATADTATQRNDRILGVQCILQIFAGFDRAQADCIQADSF